MTDDACEGPALAPPSILHETAAWLVVDKPAGWHCVDIASTDGAPTVVGWLRSQRPELGWLPECGLAHRLDRGTSGCLMVAKTAEDHLRLREAFARRGPTKVRKWYVALVGPGIVAVGEWTLHFVSRHRGSAKITVAESGDERTRGTCRWRVTRAAHATAAPESNDDPSPRSFDLLDIELVGPGRRHQIRAGFARMGHALAGDPLYGSRRLRDDAGEPVAIALHASAIEVDGVRVVARAPTWAR